MGLIGNFVMKKLFNTAAGQAPKLISPEAHGLVDYVHVAMFGGAALFFWNRDRRAAVTSLALSSFVLAQSLLTDYPFGVKPVISFPVHGKLDRGLVGFAATAPKMLEFSSTQAAQFYRATALLESVVVSLTDWDASRALPAKSVANAAA